MCADCFQALQNIARTLKVGTGRVLVRDYAEGDLAQARLAKVSRQQQLAENFYVRGDGTRAYYFSEVACPAFCPHFIAYKPTCPEQLESKP